MAGQSSRRGAPAPDRGGIIRKLRRDFAGDPDKSPPLYRAVSLKCRLISVRAGGCSMQRMCSGLAAVAASALALTSAQAQEKLKIGIIASLSGPPAVLGTQLRNGFQLAVKTM